MKHGLGGDAHLRYDIWRAKLMDWWSMERVERGTTFIFSSSITLTCYHDVVLHEERIYFDSAVDQRKIWAVSGLGVKKHLPLVYV